MYSTLPELAKLEHLVRGFSLLPRQPIHSLLSGRHASRLRGRGLNFEELRHYRSGDDIRTIDWKATNRTRKPQVRVYTEERDRPALIVVDQRLSMFFGSRRSLKSVAAAEVAALGAWRVLSQGDRVGAVVFDDKDTVEVRPHRSRRRVLQILKAILEKNHALSAESEVTPNPEMLNRALREVCRIAKHDFLIFLVTDFDGANDETRELMTRLAWHNDVIAAFVHDRFEIRLPEAGRLVFAEQAAQLEVDTLDAKLREGYQASFEKRLAAIREELLKRAVPVIPIDAGEEVPGQVQRHLGQTISARRAQNR